MLPIGRMNCLPASPGYSSWGSPVSSAKCPKTHIMDRFNHSCLGFAMGVHPYLPANQSRVSYSYVGVASILNRLFYTILQILTNIMGRLRLNYSYMEVNRVVCSREDEMWPHQLSYSHLCHQTSSMVICRIFYSREVMVWPPQLFYSHLCLGQQTSSIVMCRVYRWGIKLSPTTLFYLHSCHQVISLAKIRMLLFNPFHLASPLAVW